MASRLGFVGLGVMGSPMAGHLVAAGRDVTVWNRTPEKAAPLAEAGAQIADSLDSLPEGCEVVFLCISRTEDVQECLARMTPSAAPGTLFVDHSTILPQAAAEMAQTLWAQGLRFVDAPITGGSMGAQRGTLTVFCGGEVPDCAQAIQAMQPYTKRAERVGPSGSGQMAKMANQIAVGGALLALCESLSFAQKAGLDTQQVLAMLSSGAAGSWAMENYGPKILARDWAPGFSIRNQVKDFAYCEQAAARIGAALPGTQVVHRLLREMLDAGHGEWTTAALYERFMEMSAEA